MIFQGGPDSLPPSGSALVVFEKSLFDLYEPTTTFIIYPTTFFVLTNSGHFDFWTFPYYSVLPKEDLCDYIY